MALDLTPLLQAGTAVISDIFDQKGLMPPVLDNSLFPLGGPGTAFIGPVYTITGQSQRWTGGGDRKKLAAIDAMTPGVIPLWAGGDIRGVCCFGDLLAEAMKARGVAGVVVDGGVRDTAFLRQMGMPIFSRYRTPAQAIGRWRVIDNQIPVQVRGAVEDRLTVYPGDILAADDDGIIVIPGALAAEMIDEVIAWAEKDSGASGYSPGYAAVDRPG